MLAGMALCSCGRPRARCADPGRGRGREPRHRPRRTRPQRHCRHGAQRRRRHRGDRHHRLRRACWCRTPCDPRCRPSAGAAAAGEHARRRRLAAAGRRGLAPGSALGRAQDRRADRALWRAVLRLAGAQDAQRSWRHEARGAAPCRVRLRGRARCSAASTSPRSAGRVDGRDRRPTAPARPRCSGSWRASFRPPPARPGSTGRPLGDWPRGELARSLAYLPQERIVHWALTRPRRRGARPPAAIRPMGATGERHRRARPSSAALAAMDVAPLAGRPGAGRCRVANAPACWLRARWRSSRKCCSPTSRPPASIPPTSSRCSSTLPRLRRAAAPSLWRCTICRLPRASATGSCSSVPAAPWPRDAPAAVLTPAHLATAYGIRAEYRTIDGIPAVLASTCCHDAAPVRRS